MNITNNKPGTRIVKCACSHEYQDKTYGKGNRVANNSQVKGKSTDKYICTVCGKEHLLALVQQTQKS